METLEGLAKELHDLSLRPSRTCTYMREQMVKLSNRMVELSKAEASAVQQLEDIRRGAIKSMNLPEDWPAHGNAPLAIFSLITFLSMELKDQVKESSSESEKQYNG